MAEAIGVFAAHDWPFGADQSLADEAVEQRADLVAVVGCGERDEAALVEDLAFDRGVLEQAALVGLEPFEAGSQERLDRRWHDDLTVPSPSLSSLSAMRASICSRKSGLPAAALATRARVPAG